MIMPVDDLVDFPLFLLALNAVDEDLHRPQARRHRAQRSLVSTTGEGEGPLETGMVGEFVVVANGGTEDNSPEAAFGVALLGRGVEESAMRGVDCSGAERRTQRRDGVEVEGREDAGRAPGR